MDLWSVLSRVRPVARPLGVALLVLGVVVAGVSGYLFVAEDPESLEVTREATTVNAATEYGTAATVTGNSTLFERGSRIRDAPRYVLGATPRIEFRSSTLFSKAVQSLDSRLWLELRSVGGDDSEPFWTERRLLDRTEVGATERARTNATLNASALVERRGEVFEETGGRGEFEALLVSRTYFEDPVTGERRTLERRYELTLTGGALLSVSPAGETGASRTYTEPRTVAVPRPTPIPWLRFGASAGLAALGVGLLLIGRRDAVLGRSIERDPAGRWERTLGRYSEWISGGSLVYHESEEAVQIDDIGELVKVAMNNRGGLVHCDTTDIVAYIDGDVTYYCQGPDSNWDPQNTLQSAFDYRGDAPEEPPVEAPRADAPPSADGPAGEFAFDGGGEDG